MHSGNPRTVGIWKRGTELKDAHVIYEGRRTNISISPMSISTGGKHFVLEYRAVSLDSRLLYVLDDKMKFRRLMLPSERSLAGFYQGFVILHIGVPGRNYLIGSCLAIHLSSENTHLVYRAEPQQSITLSFAST